MFNIITRSTILEYGDNYPKGRAALNEWYYEFKKQTFLQPGQLKSTYRNASVIGDNRVVFNIKGNEFRLIVKINYFAKAVYVIWFGTHAEYDKIDVGTVGFKR